MRTRIAAALFAAILTPQLAADGTLRAPLELKPAARRLTLEDASAARDGVVITGVHITDGSVAGHRPAIVRLDGKGQVTWARTTQGDWLPGMGHAIETSDGDVFATFRRGEGIKTMKAVDWKAFAGSPVFDDQGALAGILTPDPSGPRPGRILPLHDVLR